jgi:hypothetical protein
MRKFILTVWLLAVLLPVLLVLRTKYDGAKAQATVRPLCTTIECVIEKDNSR